MSGELTTARAPPAGLTNDDLILVLKSSDSLYHLAKTPILSKDTSLLRRFPQLYVYGYNVGGRPEGLWAAKGATWLEFVGELCSTSFPLCCHLYDIRISSGARILHITNGTDLRKFDKQFPSYWLNLDYFSLDFRDYLTGKPIVSPARHVFSPAKLRRNQNHTWLETLIDNKIVFRTKAEARAGCQFYRDTSFPLERFKYKNWDEVSKVYEGASFAYDRKDKDMMHYFWYQSLDIPSMCVWDVNRIQAIIPAYSKNARGLWTPGAGLGCDHCVSSTCGSDQQCSGDK